MTVAVNGIKLPISENESSLPSIAAETLGIPKDAIKHLAVKRISLDARKKNDIFFSYSLELTLPTKDEARLLKRNSPNITAVTSEEQREIKTGSAPLLEPVIVVGLGPGGLFAAYMLAKYGYRPIVIERGQPIEKRKQSVERFWSGGALDAESNIMFGEGGAGAFSDGKLTTRIKDLRAHEAVDILARFGAPEEIRTLAKPHIGTDLLTEVVGRMRREIEALGGEVRFGTRLDDIQSDENGNISSITVQTEHGSEKIPCCACVLAVGQGARDTYEMLERRNIELAPKAFAVGVRIEHPREIIDRAQYGAFAGHPRLGAAEYRLTGQSGERGVYTFCMCPGGLVVASSSGAGQVVTNGMSRHARDEANSNSAIVVQVDKRDFGGGALDGMRFQQLIERAAFAAGGGDYTAPAETVGDYLKKTAPRGFGAVRPTYRPGVRATDLYGCLPGFVSEGIAAGIRDFGRKLKGFDMADAVMTAVESRTSSPVRIMRNETGEATRMAGLYPVGEGAGYAGGIVSAAVDGMRSAERIMEKYRPL